MSRRKRSKSAGKNVRRSHRARLTFERLEDRVQPSVTPCVVTCDPIADEPCDPTVPAQCAEPEMEATLVSADPPTAPANGPAPTGMMGGPNMGGPNTTWSLSTSYVYINGGSPFLAIQFDQPIDPSTVVPGVNLFVVTQDDPWFDPWVNLAIETEYDASTNTLYLLRPFNELGFRSSFSGNNYRIILGGDSEQQSPIRGPELAPGIEGAPLGFSIDHTHGKNIEIRFTLDDGISVSKTDVSAGPAPAPVAILIAPEPAFIISPISSTPTASGGGEVSNSVVAPVSTNRLQLNALDLQSGAIGILPVVNAASSRGLAPSLAAPLCAAPVGGIRAEGAAAGNLAGDRLDLSGIGDEEVGRANGSLVQNVDAWKEIAQQIAAWAQNLMTPASPAPTVTAESKTEPAEETP